MVEKGGKVDKSSSSVEWEVIKMPRAEKQQSKHAVQNVEINTKSQLKELQVLTSRE